MARLGIELRRSQKPWSQLNEQRLEMLDRILFTSELLVVLGG